MEVREASANYSGLSELPDEAVPFGYRQTEVGVIPRDWNLARLGDYATFRTGPFGSALHKADYVEDGVPVINPMQIDNGRIIPTASMAVTEAAARKLGDFRLAAGEVIIGRRGEMGRCAVVPKEQAGWLCGTGSMIVRAKPSLVAGFIQRVLSSPPIISAIENASVGSTMINLNQGTLANLRLALPPVKEEQEAIAEALSDADALIESLEQLIAKKRQIKQGVMQTLLSGKRRLPGFGGKWKTVQLGELANIKTGSRNNQDKVSGGLYPFFVRSDTVERINSFSYDCEAILVPGEGRIGEIFHYINGRFDVHQRVYAITQFVEGVSGRYIHLYMAAHFGNHAMENSVKATVDSLRLPTFQEFEVRLPPSIEEQTAIATILSDMDTELAELETRLAKTRQLKQGMMQELLTGRIRLV
jgi:type I restriction enzyme S subunit